MDIGNGDQVYYQQLYKPLLHAIHGSMRFGELGSLDSGYHLLCRHEDRLMWVQVCMCNNFVETSCILRFIKRNSRNIDMLSSIV